MAISVDLGKQLEAEVDAVIKDGRYGSKSELLREGVRLVLEREAAWQKLWSELDKGIADADAGRLHDADDVFDQLEAKFAGAVEPATRRKSVK